jgi:O-antigen/teichoic acid export membrane protein
MTSNGSGVGPASAGARRGLTRQALGGMLWTFSGTGVQVAVQFLAIMALGRLITPAEFGLMAAANVIVGFSQIVSQVGVGPAIIQRRTLRPAHVRVAVTLSVAFGSFLGILVYVQSPAIAAFYRIPALEPVLRAVAFMFPLDGLNTVARSLLTRQLRFRRYIMLDAGSYILGYACVGVFLAWRGYGIWALVTASIAQLTLRTVAMYLVTRHPVRPSFDLQAGRDLVSFGFGHSMAQIGVLISQQGDNIVVGRWLGPAALGVYGRAYGLMVMPAFAFGQVVNRVLFPIMAQVKDERHRLVTAYERGIAIVAFISLPISSFLWVVAPEFIPLVLGPAWGEVVLPFRLFTISLMFRMGSKISDACIKAAGAVYAFAALQFAYAALVVTGALVGQRWGVSGVAVFVSLAMGFDWLLMVTLGRRVTGLAWGRFAAAHASPGALAFVVGAGAILGAEASRSAHLGNALILLCAGLAAAVAAVGAARFLPGIFLGQHGTWAFGQTQALLLRRFGSRPAGQPPELEELAPLGEGSPK